MADAFYDAAAPSDGADDDAAAMRRSMRAMERRLARLENAAAAEVRAMTLVAAMLRRDLGVAHPAVGRAITHVEQALGRMLPAEVAGDSSLVWLANGGCALAMLSRPLVLRVLAFVPGTPSTALAAAAPAFGLPQPSLERGRTVASFATRVPLPFAAGAIAWLDASVPNSVEVVDGVVQVV